MGSLPCLADESNSLPVASTVPRYSTLHGLALLGGRPVPGSGDDVVGAAGRFLGHQLVLFQVGLNLGVVFGTVWAAAAASACFSVFGLQLAAGGPSFRPCVSSSRALANTISVLPALRRKGGTGWRNVLANTVSAGKRNTALSPGSSSAQGFFEAAAGGSARQGHGLGSGLHEARFHEHRVAAGAKFHKHGQNLAGAAGVGRIGRAPAAGLVAPGGVFAKQAVLGARWAGGQNRRPGPAPVPAAASRTKRRTAPQKKYFA